MEEIGQRELGNCRFELYGKGEQDASDGEDL